MCARACVCERERKRERFTFANPGGKGGIILNAVGRLSNLYLFVRKTAPVGATGRISCLEAVDSCCINDALVLGMDDATFSVDLFLSTIISAHGDDAPTTGSEDLGVVVFATSVAIPTLCLLAAGSTTASPLTPVACKVHIV